MIYLLTGPIQSGKTTAIAEWITTQTAGGILTPVINGERVFTNVESGETFPMEAGEKETGVFRVGRYRFLKQSFQRAAEILLHASKKDVWLIIDEAGPLELAGDGFAEVMKEIFQNHSGSNILVVAREGLATKVIEHFGLSNCAIIRKENLKELV